jgi:hypothetical protein
VESFAKLKKTAIILTHALYNTRTSLWLQKKYPKDHY